MLRIIILLIKIYQKYISFFLPARCRFYPTCSQYMIDALVKYGILKGFIRGKKNTKVSSLAPGWL
jgi:putative membrane protein insertion efficiency factor